MKREGTYSALIQGLYILNFLASLFAGFAIWLMVNDGYTTPAENKGVLARVGIYILLAASLFFFPARPLTRAGAGLISASAAIQTALSSGTFRALPFALLVVSLIYRQTIIPRKNATEGTDLHV